MTTDAGRRAVTIPMADWNRQVESSGIAEYGRLKAEQERDYFYDTMYGYKFERDRYKAALERIYAVAHGWPENVDDGDAWALVTQAIPEEIGSKV